MRTALFSLFSITCSEKKLSVVAGASYEVPYKALRVMLMFLTNDATNKSIEQCRVKH
jgi:hypothetical protein